MTDHLNFVPRPTENTITVVDGSILKIFGGLRDISVTFGGLTAHLNFLTIRDAPLGVIIESPAFEKIGAIMDFPAQFVDLTKNEKTTCARLEADQRTRHAPAHRRRNSKKMHERYAPCCRANMPGSNRSAPAGQCQC